MEQESILQKQISTGSCFGNTEIDLLEAIRLQDITRFYDILNDNDDIDIDKPYDEEPCEGSTLLEYTCRAGLSEFAKALLKHKCDVSSWKPAHIVTGKGDAVILKYLLEEGAKVDCKNRAGQTPIHIAATKNHVNCLKVIFEYGDHSSLIDLQDVSGRTPAFYAATNKNKEALTYLAEQGANLSIQSKADGMNTLDKVKEKIPELYDKLKSVSSDAASAENPDAKLWWALKQNDLVQFKQALKLSPDVNAFHTDKNCLHFASKNGLVEFVRLLLENKADVNLKDKTDERTAVHHAAAGGHFKILQLLDRYGADLNIISKSGWSPLHFITLKLHEDLDNAAYEKCLEFMLVDDKVNVNVVDQVGNTPLHFAANNKNEEAVMKLLKRGADFTKENDWGDRALDRISVQTMNTFFDSCITLQEDHSKESMLLFDYTHLVSQNEPRPIEDGSGTYSKVNDELRAETRILRHLAKKKYHWELLKHPLISSFLNLKWQRCWLYYLFNTVIYVLFVALLTYYCLDSFCSESVAPNGSDEIKSSVHLKVIKVILFIVNLFLALRETFQFFVAPVRYIFMIENLAEWTMILCIFVVLFPSGLSVTSQHSVAAAALFIAWVELVLLCGRYRKFSVSVSIFVQVSQNFVKLMAWYSVFIFGFVFTFMILFGQSDGFQSVSQAVLKVMVMMTGEFDYGGIPIASHPFMGGIMFLLFLFFVTIVLMNLLTGLAVEDTRLIRNNAEIIYQKSLLDLISYIEAMFFGDYQFLKEYPKLAWVPHCFPCKNILKTSSISKFVHYSGKHTLLFYNCLPSTKVSVKLDQDKHLVDGHHKLSLRKGLIADAKQLLHSQDDDMITKVRNVENKVEQISKAMKLLTNNIDFLVAEMKKNQPLQVKSAL